MQRVKPHWRLGLIALVCLRYENVNEPYLGRVWYDVVLVSLRSARLKSSLVCGEACLLPFYYLLTAVLTDLLRPSCHAGRLRTRPRALGA